MPKLRTTLPALACGLLLLAGCSGKPAAAPPPAPAVTTGPTSFAAAASATPAGTPSPTPGGSSASATPPANDPTPVRLDGLSVGSGDRFTVRGRLLDHTGQPIIGAVGDFYLEGSARNLVQSYATGTDGGFTATFGAADVPPEATLMMHYRGDDQHASTSFLIRRGVPRPTPTASPSPSPTAAPPAGPTPTPAGTPAITGPASPTPTPG